MSAPLPLMVPSRASQIGTPNAVVPSFSISYERGNWEDLNITPFRPVPAKPYDRHYLNLFEGLRQNGVPDCLAKLHAFFAVIPPMNT